MTGKHLNSKILRCAQDDKWDISVLKILRYAQDDREALRMTGNKLYNCHSERSEESLHKIFRQIFPVRIDTIYQIILPRPLPSLKILFSCNSLIDI